MCVFRLWFVVTQARGVDQCGTGARPPTFQLGGDAIGTAFLLARDLILSQFSIDCCQNAFASVALPRTPLEGLQRPPPDPQLENWGHTCNVICCNIDRTNV